MSDSNVLVQVENVSKNFCRRLKRALWYGVKDLTSELLGRSNSNAKETFELRGQSSDYRPWGVFCRD